MPETESICPACESPNLWEEEFTEDGYPHAIYSHCYECGFCWDSKLEENPNDLQSEARGYTIIYQAQEAQLPEQQT